MAKSLPGSFIKREKTMNRVKNLITIAAFSLVVLGLPAMASAQYGQYDPYGRNGGNNNGGYGNGSYGNMSSTVRNLKNRARDFQRQLDRDLDRSRYNGTRREDQMNDLAKRFKSAVDRLDSNGYYGGSGNYNDRNRSNRGDDELRRVFDAASQIERSIGRSNASFQSQNIWSGIRNDLQTLSRGYGNNNSRGNNNGGWGNTRGNTNRNGLPSWWPF